MCSSTNDQYVVFADIINKITRTGGKVRSLFLVDLKEVLKIFEKKTRLVLQKMQCFHSQSHSKSCFTKNFILKSKNETKLSILDVRLICWNLMKTFNVPVRANSFCDINEFNANSGPEDNADKIQVFLEMF